MISNFNEILHVASFLFALTVVVGYSLAAFSFVHEKNRIATQINMLTALPVSILAFYLLNVPLFSLISDTGEPSSAIWYRLAAIGIFSSLIVAAAMQERALVFGSCGMAICVSLMTTIAYSITIDFDGWLVSTVGYRDAFAAGPLHSVAGGFALGVIMVMRARLSRLETEQPNQAIPINTPTVVFLGLLLVALGILSFKLIFISFDASLEVVNIYGQFINMGKVISNNLVAFAVGMLLIIALARNNFYYALCGGLAAMSSIAAASDIYTAQQSILVSIIVVSAAYLTSRWFLSRGIDDLISAVFIHGLAGFYGLIVSGFLLSGQVVHSNVDSVLASVPGQLLGAGIMFIALGFIPGFAAAWLFRWFDILRVPRRTEILGSDMHYHHKNKADLSDCIDIDLAAVETERIREIREEANKV